MRTKKSNSKQPAEQVVKDIRRRTRRHFSAEDKIRIVLDVRAQFIRGMIEHRTANAVLLAIPHGLRRRMK